MTRLQCSLAFVVRIPQLLPIPCACLSAELQTLTLKEPNLPRLPAALAAATALTSLSLASATAARLANAAEWDACLPPGLHHLGLVSCGLTDIPPSTS